MARVDHYVVKTKHILDQKVVRDENAKKKAKDTYDELRNARIAYLKTAYADNVKYYGQVQGLVKTSVAVEMAEIGKLTNFKLAQIARVLAAQKAAAAAYVASSKAFASSGYGYGTTGTARGGAPTHNNAPSAVSATAGGISMGGKAVGGLNAYTTAMNHAQKATVKTRAAITKLGFSAKASTTQVQALGSATKQAATDSHSFFQTMKRAAVTVPAFYAIAAGFMAITAAVGAAFTRVTEFDLATRTLTAVLSGQTLASTRAAAEEFDNLSTVLGGTIADYEKSALLLARSGIGDIIVDDLTKAVGVTSKLSLITGENLELAASAIITFKQAYSKGANGLEAYGGSIKSIGDKIAFMANASKLSLQDIGTFSNYAVSAGKAAGLTQDALNGMAIAFSNAGNKASTIGTQIRRFTATLTSSREGVIKFYKVLGVNRQELNSDLQKSKSGLKEDIKYSNDAMVSFIQNIASMDQIMYNTATAGMAILDKQFFDNIRNSSDEIVTNIEMSFKGVDGALDKTSIMADSLSKRWEAMGNSLILNSQGAASKTSEFFTNLAEQALAVGGVITNAFSGTKEFGASIISAQAVGTLRDLRTEYEELNYTVRTGTEVQKKEAITSINLLNKKIAAVKDYDMVQNRNAESDNLTKKMKLEEAILKSRLVIYGIEQGDVATAKLLLSINTHKLKVLSTQQTAITQNNALQAQALTRAKKLAGYDKLSVDAQKKKVEAIKDVIRAEQKLQMLMPTTKADTDEAKAYSTLVDSNKALERMNTLIHQNDEAMLQYGTSVKNVKMAEDDRRAATTILKDISNGDNEEASVKLMELKYRLSKTNTQEAKNLLEILNSISGVNQKILNIKAEKARITTNEFKQSIQEARAARQLAKAYSDINKAKMQTKVLTAGMSADEVAIANAKNDARTATMDMVESQRQLTMAQSKYAQGAIGIKEVEEAQLATLKDKKDAITASNTALALAASLTLKLANNLATAANRAIDLRDSLRSAVDAYNSAIRAGSVINGKMTSYDKNMQDAADKLKTTQDKILGIREKQLTTQKALNATGDKKITDPFDRKTKEDEIKKLGTQELAENTKLENIKNKMQTATLDNNVKNINQQYELKKLEEARNNIAKATVGHKERALQKNREALQSLQTEVTRTKEIYDARKGYDPDKEYKAKLAYEQALFSLEDKKRNINDNKRDIADSNKNSGAADARAAQKAAADEVTMLVAKAELTNSIYRLESAMNGVNIDGIALEIRKLDVYKAQAEELQNAADISKDKAKADKSNLVLQKKAMKAQTKANNSSSKYYEKRNKLLKKSQDDAVKGWLDVASTVSSALNSPFDGLIDSVKSFYSSIQSLQDAHAAYTAAKNAAMGEAAAPTAVAQASAQAGIYGATIMMAILAAIGIGTSIAGIGMGSAEPPKTNTYHAESDSLSNALDDILDVQYSMLDYTRTQTEYLRAIANSFGMVESSLFAGNVDLGGNLVKSTSSDGFAFGGSTRDLESTSVTISPASIDAMANGLSSSFLDTVIKDIDTKWYGASDTTYDTYRTSLNADLAQPLADAAQALLGSYKSIGDKLGMDMRGIGGEVIDIGMMDTTGMDAEEFADKLEKRFSADADAISRKYFSLLDKYRLDITDSFQKAVAISIDFDQLSYSLGLMGVELQDVTQLIDTSAMTWMEIVTTPFKSITTYAWEFTEAMIEAAGSIDSLKAGMNDYMDNFFSAQEKYDMNLDYMTLAFKALDDTYKNINIALPKTNKEFRALVEGLDLTTLEGASAYGELMNIAGSFSDLTTEADDLTNATDDITSAIADIADAWLGSLSYLTLAQKSMFADEYAKLSQESGSDIDTVEATRLAAEAAMKTTQTKEEYMPIFDRYIAALEDQAEEATLDDVVDELVTIADRVKDLEETFRRSA